jgi:hypothetical protein
MTDERIPLSQLRPGPVRHPQLDPDLIERIRAFKQILAEVDTSTIDQTIDNFKRDQHPAREVAIFERIAATYQLYLSHNLTDDLATKKDIFHVLVGASMGVEDFADRVRHLSRIHIDNRALTAAAVKAL